MSTERWNDEMLDDLTSEVRLLTQAAQATSRDVAQLVTTYQDASESHRETDARLDRLTNLTERFIDAASTVTDNHNRMIAEVRVEQQQLSETVSELRVSNQRQEEIMEELRASNRRQERINDFLLRQTNGD